MPGYRTIWKHAAGIGSLGFGALGVAKPDVSRRLVGSTRDEARELGFRDLGCALVIYSSDDPRPGIAARMLFDVGDAVVYGRRKPAVAVIALAAVALGAVALVVD